MSEHAVSIQLHAVHHSLRIYIYILGHSYPHAIFYEKWKTGLEYVSGSNSSELKCPSGDSPFQKGYPHKKI